jgi:hypothetical protein
LNIVACPFVLYVLAIVLSVLYVLTIVSSVLYVLTIVLSVLYVLAIVSSVIMKTSFSGGKSRSTRRKPSTMGKQLVNLITCDCESIAPFLKFTQPDANPRRIGDVFV